MKTKTTRMSIRSIALLMALVLVIGIAFVVPTQAAADTGSLGKLVDHFQSNNSTFTLNNNSRFFLAVEPTGTLLQTVQLAQRQFAADNRPSATPMDIVWGDTKMLRAGDIFVQLVTDDANIGPEGYKIEVGTYTTVTAEDTRGLLYGLNMLQKHFRNGNNNSIKGFTTYDTPDTKERTVQLDCARKYFTVEYICNFIKEASWMGYNTLQLHFSEDGGFRADLWDDSFFEAGYTGEYKPENDFSWLCGSSTQSWTHKSDVTGVDYTVDPDKDKHLYTQDLFQIIDTCKEYHIDIIPSFDSPAHMDYLTWKFEQHHLEKAFTFKYNGASYASANAGGIINYYGTGGAGADGPDGRRYTAIDITNSARGQVAQAFVLSIYKDMADFFRIYAGSTKFNIGADEIVLDSYTSWQYSSFAGYINKVNALLESKGYTSRMFNDFIDSTTLAALDDDIEILYWNTPFNTLASSSTAATGYYTVHKKYNGYNVISSSPMLTVANYIADGRTVYNCVNQHTYYVLRINENQGDARSKICYQWEFYGAGEEAIWNDWHPDNIRKKGKLTEPDVKVSTMTGTGSLGGGYFLTWNDYAAVNNEVDVWNGVQDFAGKKADGITSIHKGGSGTGEYYSLRNRMWSNITKMWNWDINNSLNFSTFATIRSTLGDFPGIKTDTFADGTRYAKATTLPTGTAPIQLADHTALTSAVAKKLAKSSYTDETYAVYEEAYNWAVYINNQNTATAEELGQALANLKAAEAALTIKTNSVTVIRKTTINGSTHVIGTDKYSVPVGESRFNLFIPALNGYKYLRVEGATFDPSEAGDGSGYLSGTISSSIEITMWYENQVDVSRLNNLLADAITEQGNYTTNSWRAYAKALAAAQAFELTLDTQQSTVLALVKALEDARTALVVNSETTFVKAESLSGSFNKNGQVGLHIYTSSNVPTLVITKDGTIVNPDSITGQVQTLTNGDVVKYWLVFLPADEAGEFTYAVTYGAYTAEVTVTVA